jgi:hypothetical protein
MQSLPTRYASHSGRQRFPAAAGTPEKPLVRGGSGALALKHGGHTETALLETHVTGFMPD